jgi:hypothetical protein
VQFDSRLGRTERRPAQPEAEPLMFS